MYKYYFENLIKAKKLETKSILIDAKDYKDLVIYFPRCGRSKSLEVLSLDYQELMRKIKEHEGKKIFCCRRLYTR